MAQLWIGTSGWSYRDWKGLFYPAGLRQADWFAHFCRHFQTVELNVTFYRIPSVQAVQKWAATSPPGFRFAIKLNRELTHTRRLANVQEELARFNEAVVHLGDKLAVILIQLPPSFRFDAARLDAFLTLLREQGLPCRYALEPRHPSWFAPEHGPEVAALLAAHQVSLCIADWGGPFPAHETVTAPFLYVRFHGPAARYASKYSDEEMASAAGKIRQWLTQQLDVYVYFNNDTHGYAIENAAKLADLLSQPL